MSSSTLFRLSGIAGLLSGLFIVVGFVLPESLAVGTAGLLSPVLGLFVLTGIYARQRKASGSLGAVGYIVESFGLALVVGVAFASTYVLSLLSESAADELLAGQTGVAFLVSLLIFLLGVILFGIATIRAGIFPRLAAALTIVGFVPISLFPFMPDIALTIGSVLAGAGIAWFGYALWSGTGETAGLPRPAA